MATYAQLQDEPWWGAEYQPASIAELCRRLRIHYGVGAGAIGSKGDNNHLQGYHRSRNWIKNSAYCTNHTYSVSRTPGDRAGGDGDWLCAIDMTIPRDALIAACQRLDVAVRAGRLEKITEWYGNRDGDMRVDGYDNISNAVASSDASHLWHGHLSFDRGRAGEDHSDLFAILTGTDMEMDMILGKLKGDSRTYVSDGLEYRQILNLATLDRLIATGVKLVEVPTQAELDDLLGQPWTPGGGGLTFDQAVEAANKAEDS